MIRILICTGCERRLVRCVCSTDPGEERARPEEVDLFTEAEVGDFLDKTLDRVLIENPDTATVVRAIRAEGIEGVYPKERRRPTSRRVGASVRSRRKNYAAKGRKVA